MSTYEELAETIRKIEAQAVVAEIRNHHHVYARWRVDDQETPGWVRFEYSERQGLQTIEVSVKLDWETGEARWYQGSRHDLPFNVEDPEVQFAAWKSKWDGKITELFHKFFEMPDPADFPSNANALDTTGEYLNGGGFKIGDTEFRGTNLDYYLWQVGNERSKLDDWSGPAAQAFRDNYLATWNGNLSNQFAALCLMKLSIEREEALWTKSREQIALAADHALEAMKAADGGGGDFTLGVAIFSAVAGVASIFVPVAGQVALGAITGALSIADAASEEPDERTLTFGADTPDGVHEKIEQALDKFDSEVWDAELAIYRPLRELQDKLAERAPFLGRGADSLMASTDPGDVGLAGDEFEVSEIQNLRIVAEICINAGGDARTAGRNCFLPNTRGIRSRRAGLGFGRDGASDQYANCTSMLRDIIWDNGLIITECGEQLDAAANTYSDTDQDSARRMQDRSAALERARKDDGDMPAPPPLPPYARTGPGPIP